MWGTGITVIECPACGQKIEAVVRDGKVAGYCAVANQYVSSEINEPGLIEPAVKRKEHKEPLPKRDSKGRFIKT